MPENYLLQLFSCQEISIRSLALETGKPRVSTARTESQFQIEFSSCVHIQIITVPAGNMLVGRRSHLFTYCEGDWEM